MRGSGCGVCVVMIVVFDASMIDIYEGKRGYAVVFLGFESISR